jgi:hypothetical protein
VRRSTLSWSWTALVGLLAAASVLLYSASASAAPSLGCGVPTTKPFLRWLDPASYSLAPGGAFEEPASAWKLANGAVVTAGNEPFRVRAAGDARLLTIPAGGSGTSPSFCVGIGSPTLRFFAKSSSLTSLLRIDVTYTTVLGTVTHPIGVVLPMPAWGPTAQQLMLANATGLLAIDGLTSDVTVRFTAVGSGTWQIDDVYVDPWKVT